MLLKLNTHTEINISHAAALKEMHINIAMTDENAEDVIKSIIEEKGLLPILKSIDESDINDIFNYFFEDVEVVPKSKIIKS